MKTDQELNNWMVNQGVTGVAMDGFADCFIGYAPSDNETTECVTLFYDYRKVIRSLMSQGMSEVEAVEFHEYNQTFGPVVFLETPSEDFQ